MATYHSYNNCNNVGTDVWLRLKRVRGDADGTEPASVQETELKAFTFQNVNFVKQRLSKKSLPWSQ